VLDTLEGVLDTHRGGEGVLDTHRGVLCGLALSLSAGWEGPADLGLGFGVGDWVFGNQKLFQIEAILPRKLELAAGRGLRPARPGRARLGMTLEPLFWLHCSVSGRCLLEYIIGTQSYSTRERIILRFRVEVLGIGFRFEVSGFRVSSLGSGLGGKCSWFRV